MKRKACYKCILNWKCLTMFSQTEKKTVGELFNCILHHVSIIIIIVCCPVLKYNIFTEKSMTDRQYQTLCCPWGNKTQCEINVHITLHLDN